MKVLVLNRVLASKTKGDFIRYVVMVYVVLTILLHLSYAYADDTPVVDEATVRQEIAEFNQQAAINSPVHDRQITIKKRDWQRRRNPPNATQSNCSNIDNRTPVLARVRNQTSASWCYAFTAADLLSYKLNTPISAADVALFYQRTKDGLKSSKDDLHERNPTADDFLKAGGDVDSAVVSVGAHGACPEQFIRSDDFYLPKANNGSHLPDPILDQLIPDVFLALNIVNDNTKDNYFRCFETQKVADMFTASPAWELPTVERDFTKSEVLEWLDYDSCHDHRINLPQNMEVVREDTDAGVPGAALLADINSQLENKNIVAIGYSPHFLYSKEHIAEMNQDAKDRGEKSWSDPNDSHASSVVARRFNTQTNQCEFLIRNSWGPDCKMYDAKYECHTTPKGETPLSGIYDDGNIWVNAKDLGKALQDIEYIP